MERVFGTHTCHNFALHLALFKYTPWQLWKTLLCASRHARFPLMQINRIGIDRKSSVSELAAEAPCLQARAHSHQQVALKLTCAAVVATPAINSQGLCVPLQMAKEFHQQQQQRPISHHSNHSSCGYIILSQGYSLIQGLLLTS